MSSAVPPGDVAEAGGGKWRDTVRGLVRAAWRVPERLLRPLRRRATGHGLARGPAPSSVLVVCYGNICRSPFAAALLARLVRERGGAVRVESAGFLGLGRPVPAIGLQLAARRSVDLSAHRSQLITARALQDAELIVVMDGEQARAVRDPVGQAEEVFDETYQRIERCVGELVAAIGPGL